jgi:hypothetical protein
MEKGKDVQIVKGPYAGKKGVLFKPSRSMGIGWLVTIAGERDHILVLESEMKK